MHKKKTPEICPLALNDGVSDRQPSIQRTSPREGPSLHLGLNSRAPVRGATRTPHLDGAAVKEVFDSASSRMKPNPFDRARDGGGGCTRSPPRVQL